MNSSMSGSDDVRRPAVFRRQSAARFMIAAVVGYWMCMLLSVLVSSVGTCNNSNLLRLHRGMLQG